jgi:hypothetical protein
LRCRKNAPFEPVLSLLSVPVDGERIICQDRLVTTREEPRQRTAAFYAQLICGTGGSREQQRVKVGGILVFLPGMMEIRKLCDLLAESRTFSDSKRFVVLGLHSSLDSQAQRAIFRKHPPGVVKIVVRDLLLLLLIVGTFRSAFYCRNFSLCVLFLELFALCVLFLELFALCRCRQTSQRLRLQSTRLRTWWTPGGSRRCSTIQRSGWRISVRPGALR